MSKKILFINQEITPYVPESTMATLGQKLPEAVQGKGYEIRTFMPKWGNINERRGQLHEVIRLSGMNIVIDDNDHPLLIKVASIPVSRVQVYFIDNEDFFSKRKMAVDDKGEEYTDNGERAIFFARGVLETVKKLRWIPDVIICQGWMSAIVPLYVKTVFADEPCYAETKVVTNLFADHLNNTLGNRFKNCVEYREITADTLAPYKDEFDYVELEKLAIDYSDVVTIAADDVNEELLAYAKAKNNNVVDCIGDKFKETYLELIENIIK